MDWFDCILCINIDARVDKWTQCVDQFTRLGFVDKVERFSAICHTDGAVGCRLSHIGCVQLAKQRGYKNVLILEDDVDFIESTFSHISQLGSDLDANEWGMCYLGSNWHYLDIPKSQFTRIAPTLFEISVRGVHCTHAYALNHTAYDVVINNANFEHCIDDFYANRILSHGVRVLHSIPIHAIQRASFSDIQQTHLFYDTLVDNYNRMIAELV